MAVFLSSELKAVNSSSSMPRLNVDLLYICYTPFSFFKNNLHIQYDAMSSVLPNHGTSPAPTLELVGSAEEHGNKK